MGWRPMTDWLDGYLEAWQNHADGLESTAVAMANAAHPDIRYEDLHYPEPFVGAAGLRDLCSTFSEKFPGTSIEISRKFVAGDDWATEWEMRGVHGATGRPVRLSGSTIGRLAPDGRVILQRDYWCAGLLQAQLQDP
jgi:hypothetical protein